MDATVRYALQQHLVHFHHKDKAPAFQIGTTEQLDTAVKISDSDTVSQCFGWDGAPSDYPELPKRNYLVACVDRWADVQVYAIYNFKQMNQMYDQRRSGYVNRIDWKVLEIPEELESDLLRGVFLEDGVVATTLEAFLGREASGKSVGKTSSKRSRPPSNESGTQVRTAVAHVGSSEASKRGKTAPKDFG